MTPCYFKLRKGLKYHCDKTFFDDNKLFGRDNLTRKYGEVIRIVKIKKGRDYADISAYKHHCLSNDGIYYKDRQWQSCSY